MAPWQKEECFASPEEGSGPAADTQHERRGDEKTRRSIVDDEEHSAWEGFGQPQAPSPVDAEPPPTRKG